MMRKNSAPRAEVAVEQVAMVITFAAPMKPSERNRLEERIGSAIDSALARLPYEGFPVGASEAIEAALPGAVCCEIVAIDADALAAKIADRDAKSAEIKAAAEKRQQRAIEAALEARNG